MTGRFTAQSGRPLAIDLFCGLGGWTDGLLAEGYDVIGFDIERHEYGEHRYPGLLVIQDVRTLHGSQFMDAALIVASPPCQAYSYRAMPWKRAKALPPPDNTLFEACFRIQREACEAAGRHIPLIVENVRGAQKWVGRARWSHGSFYLWGDVPALMPIALRRGKSSGMNWSDQTKRGQDFTRIAGEQAIKNSTAIWFRLPMLTYRRPKITASSICSTTNARACAACNPSAYASTRDETGDDLMGHAPPSKGRGAAITWLRAHIRHAGEGCLTWPFCDDGRGYGCVGFEGKTYKAHRMMCELAHGPAPTLEHHAAHSCGNGHLRCVNPRHLSWKTPTENMADSVAHGTARFGEGRKRVVLTVDQVREIMTLKGQKTQQEIGTQFGVSWRHIGKIHRGATWKNGEPGKGGFNKKPWTREQRAKYSSPAQ